MNAIALALVLAAASGPLTPEALRARHAATQTLTADVLQVKEGRRWARPLETRVRLRYARDRVEWETLEPVRSKVVIERGGLSVFSADGKRRELGAAAADPRFAAVMRLVRALLAVDLDALDREYVLKYGERELVLVPRPGPAATLFEIVRLRVDAEGEVSALEIRSPTETTRMSFADVRRVTGAP